MNDRVRIGTGATGTVVAAICCTTPLLAMLLPLFGLNAWLAGADLVLLPMLAVSAGIMAWGFYRRRVDAACCEIEIHRERVKP